MRVLALDVGTSSVKAAILDVASATPLAPVAHVPYELDHPTPEASEVPAQRVWQAVKAAAAEATLKAPEGIEGVGLSCLTPALVLLDDQDRPLGPVRTHLDRRARPAARQVWAAVGEEFLATTGNRPLPGGISAVSWRQQVDEDPYLIRRARRYLHLNGWLALVLTGQTAFDRANASFSGLYGTMTDRAWSSRWCQFFEVDPAWLPPVVSGDATVGTLRSLAASELGVPGGLPFKLGTADTSSAILACGMEAGDLLHVVGTTQVLAVFAPDAHPDPRRLTRQFGVGDPYLYVTHNPVGGAALEWLRRLCFREETKEAFYGQTVPATLNRPTRVTLDPSYLGGDRLEIEAHRAAFRDLTLATDRLDLLAAVLEAMRRGHRSALAALGTTAPPRRVFLTGGGADVVRQLIPEYAQASLHEFDEGSLRGVARLFGPQTKSSRPDFPADATPAPDGAAPPIG